MFTICIHYRAGGYKSTYLQKPVTEGHIHCRDKFVKKDLWYLRIPEADVIKLQSRMNGWITCNWNTAPAHIGVCVKLTKFQQLPIIC